MYKLIATDLDGTLLNSYGEVSKENKKAIKLAQEKNIEIVLASGRMPKAILPIASEINVNKYIISGNGAEIYDIENNKTIYSNYMSKKKVLEIIDICEKNSMFYCIYTSEQIITKSLNYNILYYYSENKKIPKEKQININIMENIYKYIQEYEGEDLLKITICDNDKTIFKSINNKLKTVKGIDILDVAHMSKKIIEYGTEEIEVSYYYTEISNFNVNKWTAIEELIKKLNITKEEVIAIGDNINDKEMIENAGIGIVTKNSSPYMKALAKQVVASNNESGVAEAIYKNIE